MTDGCCKRCGGELDGVEITSFMDDERRFIYQECDCPQPCCPFCGQPIDFLGRCECIDCFFNGHPVPLPEMQSIRTWRTPA